MQVSCPTFSALRVGIREVIVGNIDTIAFRNTETVLSMLFVIARSGLPSQSKSPIAAKLGEPLVIKSTLASNELVVILPLVLVFRNNEMLLLPQLAVAKSGLPSPSKSPIVIQRELLPVAKSTLPANEPLVILPMLEVFRNTETVFAK
jgi:hypothetical protein